MYEDLRHPSNDFFGNLAEYFALHAIKQRTVKTAKDLLSNKASVNYFSAIKKNYLDEFQDKKPKNLPCLDERTWSQHYNTIRRVKDQQASASGKKVINSKDMATLEEIKALAVICLWEGSADGINLFCLNKLLYHLGMRCCEAAGQWKKDLTYFVVQGVDEHDTDEFGVLMCFLDINKMSTSQDPVVFNHRLSILYGLYFALAIQFLLDKTMTHVYFRRLNQFKERRKVTRSTPRLLRFGVRSTSA